RGPAADAEFLNPIFKACRQLSAMVERCILLNRVFSGELAIDPQPLELWEAVDSVLREFADRIDDAALVVRRSFPASLPQVCFDGLCLEAILKALVDNAIKFNHPAGSIDILAQGRRCNGSRPGVALRIRNTGEGIPADRMESIFRLFDQVELGPTRRYGGLGLGLPLAKHLLEHSGAKIRAVSPGSGRGATFTLWLPAA
ncbi:MAG: HAMP domain-containing histidine kinase, partial [Cyanobacteria bacterium REEB65]|nr:HAMP domain-containing histidine kinase [Cyanobacteria bacterium REEB65]